MIATAHVAAGALAGVVASRVFAKTLPAGVILAAVLGLASHMSMDAIPHSEYLFMSLDHAVSVAMVESFVMCGLVWAVLLRHAPVRSTFAVAAGIGASVLPDLKFVVQLFQAPGAAKMSNSGDLLHHFHAAKPAPPIAGLVGELALAATFLVVAYLIVRRTGGRATQGGSSPAVNNTP